jgi:hypothetical protein
MLKIGHQLNFTVVKRARSDSNEFTKQFGLLSILGLPSPVLLQYGRLGRYDESTRVTIQNEPIIISNLITRRAQGENGWHIHAARQNGRM